MKAITVFVLLTFGISGCYNTFYLSKSEFSHLQTAGKRKMTVKTIKNKKIQVTWNTRIFARSRGGKRYQLTPFNFKLTSSQLIASDRDLLLELQGLKSYEVDHFSTWKTVGWVAVGLAAAAGVILGIIFTAETDKGFDS